MIQTIIFDGDKAKVERDMNTWLERMQSDSKIKFEIKDIKFIKSEDYKHGYHGVRYAAMVIYDSSELELYSLYNTMNYSLLVDKLKSYVA